MTVFGLWCFFSSQTCVGICLMIDRPKILSGKSVVTSTNDYSIIVSKCKCIRMHKTPLLRYVLVCTNTAQFLLGKIVKLEEPSKWISIFQVFMKGSLHLGCVLSFLFDVFTIVCLCVLFLCVILTSLLSFNTKILIVSGPVGLGPWPSRSSLYNWPAPSCLPRGWSGSDWFWSRRVCGCHQSCTAGHEGKNALLYLVQG